MKSVKLLAALSLLIIGHPVVAMDPADVKEGDMLAKFRLTPSEQGADFRQSEKEPKKQRDAFRQREKELEEQIADFKQREKELEEQIAAFRQREEEREKIYKKELEEQRKQAAIDARAGMVSPTTYEAAVRNEATAEQKLGHQLYLELRNASDDGDLNLGSAINLENVTQPNLAADTVKSIIQLNKIIRKQTAEIATLKKQLDKEAGAHAPSAAAAPSSAPANPAGLDDNNGIPMFN